MKKRAFKKISHALEAILAYALYGVFWALPLDTASWLGGKIGELIGKLLPATNVAITNLRLCKLQLSESEANKIIQLMWNNLGIWVSIVILN